MRNLPKKEIKSFDEITEANTYYFLLNENGQKIPCGTNYKWVMIEWDEHEKRYCVFRKFYPNQLYDFVIKGDYVHEWKTFNGALRFIKKNFQYHFND